MKKDELGSRMKNNYEDRYRFKLTRRTPVIMRLDGKAFHTFTRNFKRPFDSDFMVAMMEVSMDLLNEIQGAKCVYTQSDEISILITDYDKLTTDAWFDYNVQKMVSISASLASTKLRYYLSKSKNMEYSFPIFDSRVFNIPKEEVVNYFIWRQKDWIRNSVQMLTQYYFSQKDLYKKKIPDMHEMLNSKGINWADCKDSEKNGSFLYLGENLNVSTNLVFSENREIFDNFLNPPEKVEVKSIPGWTFLWKGPKKESYEVVKDFVLHDSNGLYELKESLYSLGKEIVLYYKKKD